MRQITPVRRKAIPLRSRWQLAWSLSLPKLEGQMSASLRIGSGGSSVLTTRPLCSGCSTRTSGISTLTARQAASLSQGNAVVVVRTRSAKLRGTVKVSPKN